MNPNYPFSSYPQGLPRPSSDADTIVVQYKVILSTAMAFEVTIGTNSGVMNIFVQITALDK